MIYKASYSLIKPKNTKNLNNTVFNESLRPVLHGINFLQKNKTEETTLILLLTGNITVWEKIYPMTRKNLLEMMWQKEWQQWKITKSFFKLHQKAKILPAIKIFLKMKMTMSSKPWTSKTIWVQFIPSHSKI